MSMFPDDYIESSTEEETATEDSGVDFGFDYETGQHIMSGGLLSECSLIGTVKQFIQNVLRTKMNAFKVYTKDEEEVFGISVYDYLYTRTLPEGYLNSELKREVTEQLLNHPLVSAVSDWSGERERHGLKISFTVTLTDGSILEEEDIV